eukprot:1734608-Amphidinium_carterae.1
MRLFPSAGVLPTRELEARCSTLLGYVQSSGSGPRDTRRTRLAPQLSRGFERWGVLMQGNSFSGGVHRHQRIFGACEGGG